MNETEKVSVEALDLLIEDIAKKRSELKEQELVCSKINGELVELNAKATAYLNELGRKNYKAKVGTFTLVQKWRVNLPKTEEEKSKLFSWLKEKGIFEQYITVNSNSLNSLYMAEWEAAKRAGELEFEVPGVAAPTLFETVSFRGDKGADSE